ncbi:UDP-glucose 4-epimerase GalE [Paenibacillus hemerocallicola]|uniref:UDP-glucose 4-epimerase n=1 Tax=Paenibacillus hemerocallicola TaxID=1172614 RepID=A0A5C4T7N4_9BACL|nr:UDP-glucose 4-epimerase GalE [Paenibacillus hemerocallicola]TNJ64806.1 UDP-glucose 4-epimerase GalE [Paenibacillus hemerocallicola]
MNNIVLVTGGAGYIGSHTCKRLEKEGYLPVVYDHLSTGHADFVKWGPLEQGDILDSDRLTRVLAKYNPAAVIHFAASAYVGESVSDPSSYYRNNVTGTLSLLQAMRSAEIGNIVFSSSCAVYGISSENTIKEEHPLVPVNPYGRTKSIVEHMLRDFAYAYGIRTVSLRYFNAAGADPDGEIGEHHDPETHLIPLLLDVAAGRVDHVDIYGNDYSSEDGTCVRDYVHVSDLADAHVMAMDKLMSGISSPCYNLGSGQGHTVLQLVRAVERVTGAKVTVRPTPRRVGDPPRLVCDPSRALAELGWKPKHSSLEEMLKHAWLWHRKRFLSP